MEALPTPPPAPTQVPVFGHRVIGGDTQYLVAVPNSPFYQWIDESLLSGIPVFGHESKDHKMPIPISTHKPKAKVVGPKVYELVKQPPIVNILSEYSLYAAPQIIQIISFNRIDGYIWWQVMAENQQSLRISHPDLVRRAPLLFTEWMIKHIQFLDPEEISFP